jgi:hypothetical protein
MPKNKCNHLFETSLKWKLQNINDDNLFSGDGQTGYSHVKDWNWIQSLTLHKK